VTLDDDLIAEGTARELVNRIQNLRKSSGLNVTDRISIEVEALPGIAEAIGKFGNYIKTETLADSLAPSAPKSPEGDLKLTKVEWLDGEEIGIHIVSEK
jgi:isoleucyl-tRNA synthetase